MKIYIKLLSLMRSKTSIYIRGYRSISYSYSVVKYIRSDVTNAKTHGTFNETRSQIEATKREFNARLEAVEARAEIGRA
jgi:hypothetical protein